MKNKIKSFLAITLLFTTVFFSCKDEKESAPVLQFKANGKAVSLKGANLYLVESLNCCNNHDIRNYFITDGVYVNGDGWSFDNYTNATFYIALQLAVSGGSDFVSGEFPNYEDFFDAPVESTISYIWIEQADTEEPHFESPAVSEHEPVTISGGFEDGDSMTLKFNGDLTVYYSDGGSEELPGQFYFKGEVNDVR